MKRLRKIIQMHWYRVLPIGNWLCYCLLHHRHLRYIISGSPNSNCIGYYYNYSMRKWDSVRLMNRRSHCWYVVETGFKTPSPYFYLFVTLPVCTEQTLNAPFFRVTDKNVITCKGYVYVCIHASDSDSKILNVLWYWTVKITRGLLVKHTNLLSSCSLCENISSPHTVLAKVTKERKCGV